MLLQDISDRGTFSLHTLKRAMHRYMQNNLQRSDTGPVELSKPNGLSVRDMYDARLFQPGAFALNLTACTLQPVEMSRFHCSHCSLCAPLGSVSPQCYFSRMLRCVTHGWHPPCDYANITAKYRSVGNYPSVQQYKASADKEIADMVANNVLIPSARPHLINPMGAILKNSDLVRAKVLVGITIRDQDSLTLASSRLVAAGYPKVKCRMTSDLTATGVNAASYGPPFRYPSLGDALRIIKRNGFIASGDVSRYFHSFPLALEARPYWGVVWGALYYTYARACFGHTACPYYASTWSAEFCQWAIALGLDPAWMVDDWLTCAPSLEQAKEQMHKLSTMFEKCGFSMSVDKFQYGQQIVFIGVLIDTETMTMRFDATQARGTRLQLQSYMELITKGRHLDHTTVRHVCGKLNWYSEVVQSGRMHIQSWWDYERNGKRTYQVTLGKLISDTQWWIDLLQVWGCAASGKVEYKILSAEEIRVNPRAMMVVQSDASGTDGFGYYWGYVRQEDLDYRSVRWGEEFDPESTSHTFELQALEYFLVHDCQAEDAILVWVSDNQGSTWSINKGRSREPAAMNVISNILHLCDQKRLQLVALWVPRERNELADYLSHLASYLNRDAVAGKVSEL